MTTNQQHGNVNTDVGFDFIETNQGNGYLAPRLPGLSVTFHAISADGQREVEIRRQETTITHADTQGLKPIPDTHTLALDDQGNITIVKKVDADQSI